MAPLALIHAAHAQGVIWAHQFGSGLACEATALIADNVGGGYIGGYTFGDLFSPSAGVEDAYVVRVDASGDIIWSAQFGTAEVDRIDALAFDLTGGVIAIGHTWGDFVGTNQGFEDIIMVNFDQNGNEVWRKQFGTSELDMVAGAIADGAGGFVISGRTRGTLGAASGGGQDAFIARYDADGSQLWLTQYGGAQDDEGSRITADGNAGFIVAGSTASDLGGPNAGLDDAYVARFDGSGVQSWLTQFGTSDDDAALGISYDEVGGVYVCGATLGSLFAANQGSADAFVAHLDATAGTMNWQRQLGSSGFDLATDASVITGALKGVVLVISTDGDLAGKNLGGTDIVVWVYDTNGNFLISRQLGTPQDDTPWATARDGTQNGLLIAGSTEGQFYPGAGAGAPDSFVMRVTDNWACYAECDTSTTTVIAVLDIFDFLCFQDSFVNGETYACDCDITTGTNPPVCDIFDFLCFQDAFVNGCS